MKKYVAMISIVLFSSAALAVDMGLGGGFRTNDADSTTGATVDGQGRLQYGGIVWLDVADKITLRTGFMLSAMEYEIGTTQEVKLAYLMVPATIMFKIEDYGGIFAGANIGLKVKDDCSSTSCQGVESTIIPITFGGMYKVAPQVAIEVFYESLSGKLLSSPGLEDATSAGVNILFTLD